jgi:hypothetical protein
MPISKAQWLEQSTLEAIVQDLRLLLNPGLFQPVEPPEGAYYKDKVYQKFNSSKQIAILRQVYNREALQAAAKLLSDEERTKLKELLLCSTGK